MASRNERERVGVRERVDEGSPAERRRRRSECLVDALRLQLDACREDEGLAAIVVSDEFGFCVAHSGGDGRHDELAARLPMLADPAHCGFHEDEVEQLDDGDLQRPRGEVEIATFSIAGARLHACAVKEPDAATNTPGSRADVLARVAGGFSRLLA